MPRLRDRINAFRNPQPPVPYNASSLAYKNEANFTPPVPTSSPVRRIKKFGLTYAPGQATSIFSSVSGGVITRLYEAPPFNLNEVRVACEVDSFVRRAINRHVDVFTKQGYVLKGNKKAIKYLKRRFKMMELMTGKPFHTLISECAADYIKYHNVFLIKGRLQPGQNLPGASLRGITSDRAVSAYFKVAPPTISVARNREGGEILMWMQTVGEYMPKLQTAPDNLTKNSTSEPTKILIKPENMVHLYKDREEGEVFGTPFILPVIPDIKILREVEQYVIELVYLFSNPVIVWSVGDKSSGGGPEEVEEAKETCRSGPIGGIYVIPGDQDINVRGAATGVDAIEYLRYFEDRAITGLASSHTQMGRGGTANRSTARSMVDEFMDHIRGYHADFSALFNTLVIDELLMEGGFNILDEDQVAFIQFKDPDVSQQVLVENQEVQKYTNYLTTRDEARTAMGYEHWTSDMNDDCFLNQVKIPLAIIQAIDEPYTADAKTALKKTGAPATVQANPPNPNKAPKPAGGSLKPVPVVVTKPGAKGKSSPAVTTKTPANKSAPKNQHGTGKRVSGGSRENRKERRRKAQDSNVTRISERISRNAYAEYFDVVNRTFEEMRQEVLAQVHDWQLAAHETSPIFQAFVDEVDLIERDHVWPIYLRGVNECLRDMKLTSIDMDRINGRFEALLEDFRADWRDYTKILFKRIEHALSVADKTQSATSIAQGVFEALDYLVSAKSKTHFFHCRNFGYGYAAYTLGATAVEIRHYSTCAKCGKVDRIALDGFTIHSLPPFHYNCECEASVE